MRAFVVCLFDWDYQCDREVMTEVLAVFGTLEKAVEYSISYPMRNQGGDNQIEIVEMEGPWERNRYARNGKKMNG